MNGPQHYREAERMIEQANARQDGDVEWARADLAAATAHATLAAAAAFALPHVVRMRVGTDEWVDTLGIDLAEVTGL